MAGTFRRAPQAHDITENGLALEVSTFCLHLTQVTSLTMLSFDSMNGILVNGRVVYMDCAEHIIISRFARSVQLIAQLERCPNRCQGNHSTLLYDGNWVDL
jgi:hypothetical protein